MRRALIGSLITIGLALTGCSGSVGDSFVEGNGTDDGETQPLTASTYLTPVADAYVRSGTYANTKYGNVISLVTAQGYGTPTTDMQFYMRFNVPTGAIGRAILRVYCANVTTAPIEIHTISSTTWDEMSITWNNRPAIDGPIIKTVPGMANLGWNDIDLSGKVTPGQTLSLAFVIHTTDVLTLYGKDYYYGLKAPQLIVDPPSGIATLSWSAPTTNANGTPLTDLAGYKLSYGLAAGQHPNIVDVHNVTTYSFTMLQSARLFFVVQAYDNAGNVSAASNEVYKDIL